MNSIFKRFRSVFYHGYSLPVAVSVLIHAGLFALLFVSWDKPSVVKTPPPLHIKANLVEVAKPKPPAPKVDNRARIEAEKVRKAKAERRKKAEAIARKKEAERNKQMALKKKQEEEKARKIAELKKKELERQKRLTEQLKREQDELVKRLAAEQTAREQEKQAAVQAEKDATEVAHYRDLLVSRMILNWSRPPSARNNMEMLVKIQLSPFGDLLGFQVVKGSGNEAFDRSVIQAIKLGTPVVELKELDRRIFEKYFRHFTFKFSPEDLVR